MRLAAEHLVGYSTTQPAIFKTNGLEPVKDLKLLVKDYDVRKSPTLDPLRTSVYTADQPIAKNALTILINISDDKDVLEYLAKDDAFLETLLARVTVCQSPFPLSVSLFDPSPIHII